MNQKEEEEEEEERERERERKKRRRRREKCTNRRHSNLNLYLQIFLLHSTLLSSSSSSSSSFSHLTYHLSILPFPGPLLQPEGPNRILPSSRDTHWALVTPEAPYLLYFIPFKSLSSVHIKRKLWSQFAHHRLRIPYHNNR